MANKTTDFGYQQIPTAEKTPRVNQVFSDVAATYDLMNDLMSFGIHRLWKRYLIHLCAIQKNFQVLDVAGGTGDLARLIYPQLSGDGKIMLCDINEKMLQQGRNKLIDQGILTGIDYIQANAEQLPFKDNYFDRITIAFGLRNITDKDKALGAMYNKLKYGAQLIILEFSKVTIPMLRKLYDQYSFHVIPKLGAMIANNQPSYQYLVESIRTHPEQETLVTLLKNAGFEAVRYHNLSGGIVAIHQGYKL